MIYKSYVSLTLLCSINTSVCAMTVTTAATPAAATQKNMQQTGLSQLLNQTLLTTVANDTLGQITKIAIAKKLLAQGADINVQDAAGNTPVMLAARQKKEDLTVFLCLQRADTDISNKKQETFWDIVPAPFVAAIKQARNKLKPQ